MFAQPLNCFCLGQGSWGALFLASWEVQKQGVAMQYQGRLCAQRERCGEPRGALFWCFKIVMEKMAHKGVKVAEIQYKITRREILGSFSFSDTATKLC